MYPPLTCMNIHTVSLMFHVSTVSPSSNTWTLIPFFDQPSFHHFKQSNSADLIIVFRPLLLTSYTPQLFFLMDIFSQLSSLYSIHHLHYHKIHYSMIWHKKVCKMTSLSSKISTFLYFYPLQHTHTMTLSCPLIAPKSPLCISFIFVQLL